MILTLTLIYFKDFSSDSIVDFAQALLGKEILTRILQIIQVNEKEPTPTEKNNSKCFC